MNMNDLNIWHTSFLRYILNINLNISPRIEKILCIISKIYFFKLKSQSLKTNL